VKERGEIRKRLVKLTSPRPSPLKGEGENKEEVF
jgi:hypothetical protein